MANRFNFVSPGAAATNSFMEFVAEEQARRRQAEIDALAKRKADQDAQISMEELALKGRQMGVNEANARLAVEQAESLAEQRRAAAEANKQKRAAGVIPTLKPGQAIGAETSDILTQGGFKDLVGGFVENADAETPTGAADDPRSYVSASYKGTPEQVEYDHVMAMDAADAQIKKLQNYLSGRRANNGEAIPADLFDDDTQALFRVSANRRGVERFDGQDWVQHEGAIPKDAHWLQEPQPSSGGAMTDARKVATFNQIASSYERSPLIRAADRIVGLEQAVKDIQGDPSNAANQMALAYGYIQALDTYQSAVREGELQNLGALGTKAQQLLVEANKVYNTGAFMPPEVAKEVARSAGQLMTAIKQGRKTKQREYGSRAKVSGVGQEWDQFVAGFSEPEDTPAGAAPSGAVRRYNPATGKVE